jgi:hypothetical protein
VAKLRAKFQHQAPKQPQHSPHRAPPKKYGTAAHDLIPPDTTPPIDAPRIKIIQQVIGGVLYYARAVDMTVLPAQANATETTEAHVQQLLDYLATHPQATVRYHKSEMILNIHSDASYLSETKARSRVAGYFFLGSEPNDNQPIELNGAIYTLCGILKIVVASAAEAELGALFMNIKDGVILRLILAELGHPQPPNQYTATTKPPQALPMTPSRNNDPAQWRCASFGSATKSNGNYSKYIGTPAKKT